MKLSFVVLVVLTAGLLAVSSVAQVPSFSKTSAQSSARRSSQSGSPELATFFAQYFEERLRDSPEFATNVGRHEYDDRWTDLSRQGRDRRRAHLDQALATVEKFSGAHTSLSEQDRLSLKLLRYDLHTQLDALELDTYLLRVGQMTGFHNSIYLVIDRIDRKSVV